MIYHLCTPEHWETVLDKHDDYTHPTLETEGFIHCSTLEQVVPTATLHFADATELLVLHIIDKRIKDKLKMEPARDGQLFPHVYGTIPLEAVETLTLLVRDEPGAEWDWQKGSGGIAAAL